jgi:alginate O-acetyltransferase complex protein AlgI
VLFNSIDFALFCPVVFLLYWFVANKPVRLQNLLIVIASFVFYGWWHWRFLSLLIISATTDYWVGIALDNTADPSRRKRLLLISVFVNIGLLVFFKYADFLITSFTDAYRFFGADIDVRLLNIILPVGISFYTFQTLSYAIDVYRKKIQATRDIISFFAFVSFFPQLVAGPIERAGNLLPQFLSKRHFNEHQATDGLRQILWGLFKKIVVADNCGVFVDAAFTDYHLYPGSSLMIAACLFSIQIYGDFSGYSDIAIGTAKLFGFNLMINFNYPYFSTGFIAFWRKWHISLTSWFRDYVYIPLGGNKNGQAKTILNILVVFVLSGLWHGARWNFIAWALINAGYFLAEYLVFKTVHAIPLHQTRFNFMKRVAVFLLLSLSWIFFRADSVSHALAFIDRIISPSLFLAPSRLVIGPVMLSILLIAVEWMGRNSPYAIQNINLIQRPFRWAIYIILIISISLLAVKQNPFIYFQF